MKSAIVPYQGNSSSVAVKPQQSMAIVPAKKESVNKAEVTAKDIRRNVLMLLRKRQQRDRLEAKFAKVKEASKAKDAARKEESKQEKTSFLTKVGSGIKGKAEKLGGNLFGALGDLLGFIALDWISKPENQQILKGIVEGIGHVFRFVDFWVTGSVDNLLTGFSQLVGGDTLLDRFVGFFQMVAGIFGLRYFRNPGLIITDLNKIRKFVTEGGLRKLSIFNKKLQKYGLKKALKFAFPRLSKILQKISGLGGRILKGIADKTGVGKVGSLFTKITTALLRKAPGLPAAKKAIFKILKPVTKFLTGIPFVGGLISFGVNMLLGDPPGQAGVKAIGSSLGTWLGAGLGSLLLPGIGTFLGGFLGGLVGDWLGARFYDLLKGRDAKEPTVLEEERQKAIMARADIMKAGNSKAKRDKRAMLEAIAKKMGTNPETGKPYTADQVDELLNKKPEALDDKTTEKASGKDGPVNIPAGNVNLQAAKLLRNYEGLRLNAYPDPYTNAEPYTIGIGATYYPPGFRLGQDRPGRKVKLGDTITEQEAYDIKAWHVDLFAREAEKKIGSAVWNKLPANVKVALISKAFNYGEVYDSALPLIKQGSESGNYSALANYFRERLAPHNDGINRWRRNDEAAVIETGKSPRAGFEFGKGGGSPIPMQKQYRHSIMSQLSMEAVQARKFANRGGGGTVIIRTGAQTYANYTSVVNAPRVNSNTRMSQKRGL